MKISSARHTPFVNFLRLDKPESVRNYFVSNNKTLKESLICLTNRIVHFLRTFVWINEQKVCSWASKYETQKVSALFAGKSIQRKLIRHEHHMFVPKQTLPEAISFSAKFILEFLKHPTTVGAILPSSKYLAKEIVREIPKDLKAEKRLILEVGPGTGVFSDKIIRRMNPSDELHLVEYDAEFCKQLRNKYGHIPNVKIFERSILDHQLSGDRKYDFIVSGLPLNAFSIDFVNAVFKKFEDVSNTHSKLSYFEYLVLPNIKKAFSSVADKANINAILAMKNAFYQKHKFKKANVLLNVPSAKVVHHNLNVTDYASRILKDQSIKQNVKDLFQLLFVDAINASNFSEVQPLESQLDKINKGLIDYSKVHGINLKAIGSQHSKNPNDPWQTIKIIEPGISKAGELSGILVELNNALHSTYGIIGNGGDACKVQEGVKKRDPQCFVQDGTGTVMHPQLLISLIDIKRIVNVLPTEEKYVQALNAAYGSAKTKLEPLTSKQIEDIHYIVTTLGNKSPATIPFSKSYLDAAGKRIESVHTLQFLSCIFTDPTRKEAIRSLKNDGWKTIFWTQFYSGIESGLKKMDALKNLEEHLDAFAASLNIDSARLRPLVANKQWDKLVDVLFEI